MSAVHAVHAFAAAAAVVGVGVGGWQGELPAEAASGCGLLTACARVHAVTCLAWSRSC